MWRVGIAAVLLLLLVVMVVDMLFGGPAPLSTIGTPKQQAQWYSRTGQPANSGERDLAANPTRGPDGSDAAPMELLDIARLPTAAGGSDTADRSSSASAQAEHTPIGESAADSDTPSELQTGLGPALPRPEPAERPVRPAMSVPQIAEAQRKLAALGYVPGTADGRIGRRTEVAIREFQRDMRMRVDGRLDTRLLARLDAELRTRAQLRQQELEAMAPATPRKPEKEPQRGVFGSVLGGFQRLLGRDFDGVHRPEELAAYCRRNPETWIYDFGREAFVYCGNIIAGEVSGLQAPVSSAPETAATR